MCLGIPGRVVKWLDHDAMTGVAEIEFGGVRKQCQMACVPDATENDYVLVHAGIALTIIDQAAAEQLLATLTLLGEHDELTDGSLE